VPQHGGPAVLSEGDARNVRLPAELRAALREWSEVAATVLRSGDDHELDLLRRRGRQRASRVADVLGRPVQFVDPVSGAVESIRAGRAGNGVAATNNLAATNGAALVNGAVAWNGSAGSYGADPAAPARSSLAPESPGPTPWGTGLAIAAFFAVLVAVADVVLVTAFGSAFGLLWLPANLLVTAGTMPSLWLAREVPFWRWPAFGAAAGLAAAWVVMLLGLLAP
jgi:hypothetical protein